MLSKQASYNFLIMHENFIELSDFISVIKQKLKKS